MNVFGQLIAAQAENLSATPASLAPVGRFWWNTTSGRPFVSNGTIAQEVLTTTSGLANVMTTFGDMLYGGAVSGGQAAVTRLAPGTANMILQTNGAGVAPTWVSTPTLSGATLSGTLFFSASVGLISSDTVDASDTKSVAICGGGGYAVARGGVIETFGNERTTYGGKIYLSAGNSATSSGTAPAIVFEGSASTGAASATTGFTTGMGQWTFGSTASNADHKFQGALTTLTVQSAAAATSSYLQLSNTTANFIVGVAGSSGALLTGSSAGDGCIRAQAGTAIRFGIATTLSGSLSSTGVWTLGTSGVYAPHVVNGSLTATHTSASSFVAAGYCVADGRTTAASGSIRLGTNSLYSGFISYSDDAATSLYIDNSYDHVNANIVFRLRTLGTPVSPLVLRGDGSTKLNSPSGYSYLSSTGTSPGGLLLVSSGAGSNDVAALNFIRAENTNSHPMAVIGAVTNTTGNGLLKLAFYGSFSDSTKPSEVSSMGPGGTWILGSSGNFAAHTLYGALQVIYGTGSTTNASAGGLYTFNLNGSAAAVFNGTINSIIAGENTSQGAMMRIRKDGTSGRSVNAGGTINASGADYAEYMTKDVVADVVAKGQVCGVKANGKLTVKWSEAVSFVVKSTDPSYVGGDTWSSSLEESDFATPELFAAAAETARAAVDRIAFCGQVPCIVTGSFSPGDWIIPQEDTGDTVKAVAVADSSLTFAQYKTAIGQVWKDLGSGKALIKVGAK